MPLTLRLFLPKAWTVDAERCCATGVPAAQRDFRSKGEIALTELDRVQQEGITFDAVVADAGYGASASFRQELSKRDLCWAVGIHSTQKVYAADVAVMPPRKPDTGRPAQHPHIADKPVPVQHLLASLPRHAWQKLSWRRGTKGRLKAHFVGLRVRAADCFRGSYGEHTPSAEVWLIGERRASGEIRYYLTNHPAATPLLKVVAVLKARWACEQVHQQLKNELGLDHFEGRSWRGLHHHVLLTMMAFLFLQFLRLQHAKVDIAPSPGPPPAPSLPALRRQLAVQLIRRRCRCPNCHNLFFLDGS